MTFRYSVFEIRPETWPSQYGTHARDQAVSRIVETIDASTFPWWRCIPALQRGSGDRFPFPIEFMDPLDGADGYVSNRRMWLRPDTHTKPTYQTVAHELAHVADLATLGEHRGLQFFNSSTSQWRQQLLDAATWNGHNDPPSQFWQPGALTNSLWNERPIEAVTVPFTRAFWDDPKFYYSDAPFAQTWTWGDVSYVRQVFLSRGIEMFSDVPKDHTHRDNILRLAQLGIIGGFANGTYRPQDTPTRGQLATILCNVLDHIENR